MVGLILLMIFMGYIRWWQMLVAGVLLAGVVAVGAPGFLARIDTMRTLPQLLSQRDTVAGQGAIRGRLTEMLAAVHVFFDYPVLGVGPGQYTPFYSMKYMENPDIAFRAIDKVRRSHCLYAELAAETGIVGSILFFAIVGAMAARLWRLRARFKRRDPEMSNLAAAFWLGLMGYLGTARRRETDAAVPTVINATRFDKHMSTPFENIILGVDLFPPVTMTGVSHAIDPCLHRPARRGFDRRQQQSHNHAPIHDWDG